MILDGHVHVMDRSLGTDEFRRRIAEAGVSGGLLISHPPPSFAALATPAPADARLRDLQAWCAVTPGFHGAFWIDPLEPDAAAQVRRASEAGVAAFKVICDRYHPGDPRALPVYAAIAAAGRPILFHSGILWDGKPSSAYNRPAEFEPLLDVPRLRFALAHVSWPWCDECIAVYGKFLNARGLRPDLSAEMFIDLTPGTPAVYREDVLTRLFRTGYDVERNVLFGTDGSTREYRVSWAREWIERDSGIMVKLGVSPEARAAVMGGNLLRFLGLSSPSAPPAAPRPGA